jgi:hypothetical protein
MKPQRAQWGASIPLPFHRMAEGDDAQALEAPLIENLQRRDANLMGI